MYEKLFFVLLFSFIGFFYYYKIYKKKFNCGSCNNDFLEYKELNGFHCHACMTKLDYCKSCYSHNKDNLVPTCTSCHDKFKETAVPMSKDSSLEEFNLEIEEEGTKGIFQTARLYSKESALENLRLLIAYNDSYNGIINLEVVLFEKKFQARGLPVKYKV